MTDVRGIEVDTVPGLNVGYVMGIGDQVPDGIRQLGLHRDAARRGRARARQPLALRRHRHRHARVRRARGPQDIQSPPARVRRAGRQPDRPLQHAGAGAESVGAKARRAHRARRGSVGGGLAGRHPCRRRAGAAWPNKISKADFTGWVEQRGSKFWSTWDPAYRPIIATWDRGQAPQQGGWLWTRHGKGHYTYFAYAMHRQLPYGVPGAYRLMANLLAQGRTKN